MCNQVPSVTLQAAVLMEAKAFGQKNQQFSVHDITRSIRQKTADGDLEIPEVEVNGSSFRFDIRHEKVKALFDELWRTGVFDPFFSLTRNFNGVYFEYTPASINNSAYASVSVGPQTTTATSQPAAPVASSTPNSTGVSPDVAVRIASYLTNCRTRNFRPTLKQVQSAIKRGDASTGYGCDVLKAFIVGLGYTIVDDPEAESRAQVVV